MNAKPLSWQDVKALDGEMANDLGEVYSSSPRAPVRSARAAVTRLGVELDDEIGKLRQDLLAAAKVFDGRRDEFARGKGDICRDMAAKLQRFGDFASEKQGEFARKLVSWAQPRPQAPREAATPATRTFEVMQRLAKLTFDDVVIRRKQGEQVCFVMADMGETGDWGPKKTCVGVIDEAGLKLFRGRLRDRANEVAKLLADLEQNPLAYIGRHRIESGRCAVCSRDLTDPESIERGIGPICAGRLGLI